MPDIPASSSSSPKAKVARRHKYKIEEAAPDQFPAMEQDLSA